jgi:YfiR/HmsC-like
LGFCQVSAQQSTDYAVHANIIYRVTKYINWPAGNSQSGDFIIGIVGESPLYDELKKLIAGKKVDKQKIVVTRLPASASSFSCQVLFVPDDESNHFKKILGKTSKSGTLVISESDGLASEGSCINFVIIDEHLKLEINKRNIENRNLKVASELLQLGIPVR